MMLQIEKIIAVEFKESILYHRINITNNIRVAPGIINQILIYKR